VPENEFRIHSTGDLWGENCDVFGEHLWRWDGHEMELLEEAFSQGYTEILYSMARVHDVSVI